MESTKKCFEKQPLDYEDLSVEILDKITDDLIILLLDEDNLSKTEKEEYKEKLAHVRRTRNDKVYWTFNLAKIT